MYAVAVIGGGPVGLKVAAEVRKQGFDCVLIEEHASIGKPVNCAGLISRTGVEGLGIDLGDSLVNKIFGARIFSPDGNSIAVQRQEPVAYVIDREKFDRKLYEEAVREGVEVRLNTKIIGLNGETIFTQHKGRGELIKARVIIGADGAASKVRELAGVTAAPENFVQTYQASAKGNFERELVEVRFGGFAKNFFGWIIPENREVARIGLGMGMGNVKDAFREFTAGMPVQKPMFARSSALIPVAEPMKEYVYGNIALAGDAAFQTKATTGGGIIIGMGSAKVLADAIGEHYKSGNALADYNKRMSPLRKELDMHWRIRSYLNSLDERQMNKLFERLKRAKIEEFLEKEGDMDRPSKFLGKLLFKPALWKLIPGAFGLRF